MMYGLQISSRNYGNKVYISALWKFLSATGKLTIPIQCNYWVMGCHDPPAPPTHPNRKNVSHEQDSRKLTKSPTANTNPIGGNGRLILHLSPAFLILGNWKVASKQANEQTNKRRHQKLGKNGRERRIWWIEWQETDMMDGMTPLPHPHNIFLLS